MSALRRDDVQDRLGMRATGEASSTARTGPDEPSRPADARDNADDASHAKADQHPKLSLEARIRHAEERIAKRRVVVAARASDVNVKVRRKLASPLLVVAAAGAGFVVAQFRRRRDRDEPKDKREVVMKPSIFATITDALTLATTLLAMMPLIRSKAKEGVQEAATEPVPTDEGSPAT